MSGANIVATVDAKFENKLDLSAKLSSDQALSVDLGTYYKTEGTKDYEKLNNKPAINDVTLIGNKPLSAFDIQETNTYASNMDIDALF